MNRKTVRKYMNQEDFSEPVPQRATRASRLDPFKPSIDAWLQEDLHQRFKQRHTAQRIHTRLQEVFPDTYMGSYSAVQRYVQTHRRPAAATGTLDLVWRPGEAQVDFGEADVLEAGKKVMVKFLVVTFPYSNAGFLQLFRGETAECVVQGLHDLFLYLGGVPPRLVFDNASGVGHRVGEVVQMTDLFQRFATHHGFTTTFCNPYAGYEKGSVENKVGYWRRNFLVPIPQIADLVAYNATLFPRCMADGQRPHYQKGTWISVLFEQDRQALRALPHTPFHPYRYTQVKTNGYGHFSTDGAHWYSTAPEYALQEVTVRIGAHVIEPLQADGTPITTLRRQFGKARTDTLDDRTTLTRLLKNPGAWRNSGLRELLPASLQTPLDQATRADLLGALRALQELTERYDWDHAVHALTVAQEQGHLTYDHAWVLAQRFADRGPLHQATTPVDLRPYDALLRPREGVQ